MCVCVCVGWGGGGGVGGFQIVGQGPTKVSSINKRRRRVLVKRGGQTKILIQIKTVFLTKAKQVVTPVIKIVLTIL